MAIGSSGLLSVFDTLTGERAWTQRVWNSGFAIGRGKLFVSGPEQIKAIEVETGKFVWENTGPGRGWSVAPFYDPSNNVVVFNDATYRLLDPDTGVIRLELPRLSESRFSYDPNGGQVHNGVLLYMDEAYEVSTGRLIHSRTIPGAHSFLPFIEDGQFYLSNFADVVTIDLSDFTEVWRYTAPDGFEVVGDPVALDGVIYTILSDASIRALDRSTGSEIGAWQGDEVVDRRFGNSPLIPALVTGDGMLFASFGTNQMCAFSE